MYFQKEVIVPKGIIEIIFNFNIENGIPCHINGKAFHIQHCFVSGFNTSPVNLALPGHHHFFGVRLQPLAVKKICKAPGAELLNSPVDLTLLNKEFLSLWHQLAEQNSFRSRVKVFLLWIEGKINEQHAQEEMINRFLTGSENHLLSVKEAANLLCYSPRHMSRKLSEATGLNAEEILLYKKYLVAMHLVHNTDMSLTEITFESGFSDQSHFIRTFKTFTNMTPKHYRTNKSFREGHFFQNVR
jgi:AraC-like DNA-binding protein